MPSVKPRKSTNLEVNIRRSSGLNGGLTREHDDPISEVCCHDEIVLDDESCFLSVEDESLDHFASRDTLFGIQERAWFVDQIDGGGFP